MAKNLHLLLVEDDEADALLFKKYLPAGFTHEHASDANNARKLLEKKPFDVCFVDYKLGAESGLEFVRGLRDAGNLQPIVVVSGLEIEALGENALLAGATDFITKDELCEASIQRVARWSLLRRHVQTLMNHEVTSETVKLMLGTQNQDRSESALRRVMYLSQATQRLSQQEIYKLCSTAASRNTRTGITGVLVCVAGCFMQVIEGPKQAIDELMGRLSKDKRHHQITVVVDEGITQRAFAEWNMGCFSIDEMRSHAHNNWMNITDKVHTLYTDAGGGRDALGSLIQTLPGLLYGKSTDIGRKLN